MILATTFPQHIIDLITEYNINSKFNSFLYKNSDIYEYLKKKDVLINRFNYVVRCHEIDSKLSLIMHDLYHGKKVRVKADRSDNMIEGVIKHELTRIYMDNGIERETSNDTAFRYNHDEPVDITTSNQHIELWVDTGDKYTSHLYSTLKIELI